MSLKDFLAKLNPSFSAPVGSSAEALILWMERNRGTVTPDGRALGLNPDGSLIEMEIVDE